MKMWQSENKKTSEKADFVMIQILELANKEFKAAILTIISEIFKNSLDGQNSRIEMTKEL